MEYLDSKLVVKARGASDLGLQGLVLKSNVTPADHHILEVLVCGKVKNWLADFVEVLGDNDGLSE